MLLKTPPMGFNTWNTFGTNISDKLIRETADAMVERGFRDAGYEYLVIDDCWSEKQRDPVTHKLVASKEKFPDGMKAVADYVHSKGLKFGMYTSTGIRTCADYPASFDHEFLDAETFAEWGVDYLKYDWCQKPQMLDPTLMYRRMGLALNACGRDIVYSLCNWGEAHVEKWARLVGGSLYRSTGDVNDTWESMKTIIFSQIDMACYSAPGCYNDMDMLTVGMYGKGNVGHENCCTTDEYFTQFAIWCMFNSPLMLGCDVRTVSDEMRDLLCNKELIAINQDPEVRGPYAVGGSEYQLAAGKRVFVRHLSGNEFAVCFSNFSDSDCNNCFYPFDAGLSFASGYAFDLHDVMTGEKLPLINDFIELPIKAHCSRVFRGKLIKVN